jgi:hypothetical protein
MNRLLAQLLLARRLWERKVRAEGYCEKSELQCFYIEKIDGEQMTLLEGPSFFYTALARRVFKL